MVIEANTSILQAIGGTVTPTARVLPQANNFQVQQVAQPQVTANYSSPVESSSLFVAQLIAQEAGTSEALARFARIGMVKYAPSYAGITFEQLDMNIPAAEAKTYANDNETVTIKKATSAYEDLTVKTKEEAPLPQLNTVA